MRCKLKHFFSMLFTNGHITPIIGLSRRNWLDELNPPVSTSANHHLHFNLPLLAVSFTAISRSANRYQPLILPLLAVRRTAISNSLTHQGHIHKRSFVVLDHLYGKQHKWHDYIEFNPNRPLTQTATPVFDKCGG